MVATVLAFPFPSQAALWSGILDPSRATDWSQAGIPGGIPSRTNICANVLTTDTTAQIQAKITNCSQDGVVKFPAGTWTVTGLYSNKGVVLRGAGPTQTQINLNGGNIFLGTCGSSWLGCYPPNLGSTIEACVSNGTVHSSSPAARKNAAR